MLGQEPRARPTKEVLPVLCEPVGSPWLPHRALGSWGRGQCGARLAGAAGWSGRVASRSLAVGGNEHRQNENSTFPCTEVCVNVR